MVAKGGKPRLPYGQLSVLSLCRLAEPIALTSVFPYLPEMIESFGVDKNDVGQWAGFTSAVFSYSQAATGIQWGSASDVLGRKPTLLFGLFITMSATVMFGFSQSLVWAIVARGIAGASSGTVGISRTTVAEMVPWKELQPQAFSIMPLMWSIGSIIGPTFGGALAKPAEKYPQLFGNDAFLRKYPFAFPNIIAGVIFFLGVSVGILYLKETLETRRTARDYGLVLGEIIARPFRRRRVSKKCMADNQEASPRHSPRQKPKKPLKPVRTIEVFNTQSSLNLLSYTILAFHSIAFDQLVPVFLHLDPEDPNNFQLPFKFAGGFGLDSGRIGILFTLYAVVSMLLQFLVFPPAAAYFGVLRSYRVVSALGPVAYILMPFTVLFPTPITQQIAVLVIMCTKSIVGVFAFPCSMILLTNSIASLRLLGTLNGVATSISALGRGSGPAISGWLFTVGADAGYVILPWWILAVVALLGHVSTWFLIEMDGPKPEEDEDVDRLEVNQAEAEEHSPLLLAERTQEDYDSISSTGS